MTWYVILEWVNGDWDSCMDDPMHYLDAKNKMAELKKANPSKKYKLMKTSY